MGPIFTENKTCFLDTSYVIALLSSKDQHHSAALEISNVFIDAPVPLVTTQPVIFEICNSLAKPPLRHAAQEFLDGLEKDSSIEVISLDEFSFAAAIDLYKQRADKSWSLTDCLSFIIMKQRGIVDALTADEHFEQAGFRALLKV